MPIITRTLGSANWIKKKNRIIANKICSNISTHSYHLDLRFSCCDDRITCPLWTWKCVRLGRIITHVRSRTCVLHWSDFQGIKSLKWSLEDAKASVRLYLDKCTIHCHLLQAGVSLYFPISIDHGDVCNHTRWQHHPLLLSFMPSLFFEDGRELPLAQIKTKYNIVLCLPEIVHHLKYLRCFILLVESLRVAVSSKFPPSALIIEFGLYIHICNQQMTSVAQLSMAMKYSDDYQSHWWSLVLMWR